MNEDTVEQLVTLMQQLSEENKLLRAKIAELSQARDNLPLSTKMSMGLSEIPSTKTELSNSAQNSLDRAVEMVLAYAKATNWH
jgi:hypothetical protein